MLTWQWQKFVVSKYVARAPQNRSLWLVKTKKLKLWLVDWSYNHHDHVFISFYLFWQNFSHIFKPHNLFLDGNLCQQNNGDLKFLLYHLAILLQYTFYLYSKTLRDNGIKNIFSEAPTRDKIVTMRNHNFLGCSQV